MKGCRFSFDILVRGRKVAGILCEMIQDPAPAGILGIGVNLNLAVDDFPDDLAQSSRICAFLAADNDHRLHFTAKIDHGCLTFVGGIAYGVKDLAARATAHDRSADPLKCDIVLGRLTDYDIGGGDI